MRRSQRALIIASRRSLLARAQTEMVGQALARLHPAVKIEYLWLESEGDQRSQTPLAEAGGKGLFARAIEQALLAGEADLAVHSLKDLPTQATPGLTLAAIPRRADVRDCLIAQDGQATLEALRAGAVVGTASPRRSAQLLRLRPDLKIQLIRGNVDTRLRKVLSEKLFDATLLAMAGLGRAGLGQHAAHPIEPEVMLPAASQGALALQCRGDDHVTLTRCLPLNDAATSCAVHAERAVVAGLRGDCHSPIAVLAEPAAGGLRLRARVLSLDGKQCLSFEGEAPVKRLSRLVKDALHQLREQGSDALLRHPRV